jgi:hypothetical protein
LVATSTFTCTNASGRDSRVERTEPLDERARAEELPDVARQDLVAGRRVDAEEGRLEARLGLLQAGEQAIETRHLGRHRDEREVDRLRRARGARQAVAQRALPAALVEDRDGELLDALAKRRQEHAQRGVVDDAPFRGKDAVRSGAIDAEENLAPIRRAPAAEDELRLVAIAEGQRAPEDLLGRRCLEARMLAQSGAQGRLLGAELLAVRGADERAADAAGKVRAANVRSAAGAPHRSRLVALDHPLASATRCAGPLARLLLRTAHRAKRSRDGGLEPCDVRAPSPATRGQPKPPAPRRRDDI